MAPQSVRERFLARQVNCCTRRFWRGRFLSQALLDEKAVLACMAYVDLNPIRAKMAETPETSDHTSIQLRIRQLLGKEPPEPKRAAVALMPFVGDLREVMPKGLPFHLDDYLELVDWTGRAMVAGKRGAIPDNIPPILQRLRIDPKHWLFMSEQFESRFKGWVGAAQILQKACQQLGYRRTPGLGECRVLFST